MDNSPNAPIFQKGTMVKHACLSGQAIATPMRYLAAVGGEYSNCAVWLLAPYSLTYLTLPCWVADLAVILFVRSVPRITRPSAAA